MLKRIGRVGGLAALLGCLSPTALAQGRSEINGTVFDQGKAVLPGVAVTATHEATGITRETVTGPEGRFVIPTLTPGTYYQDDSLTATDPFLKARGEKNPESGSDVYGFSAGGPIVRNKAFWFFNVERNVISQAVQLTFPAEAAPLAVSSTRLSRTSKVAGAAITLSSPV